MCELKQIFFERLYSFDGDAFSLILTAYWILYLISKLITLIISLVSINEVSILLIILMEISRQIQICTYVKSLMINNVLLSSVSL